MSGFLDKIIVMNPFQKPGRPANIINRFVLVVDKSLSMSHLSDAVVKVFDNFIAHLAVTSKAKDQETRVTVYLFGSYNSAECVIWDMDVLRVPSLAGLYKAGGNTALVQTFLKAVREIRMIPTMYGDNSAFFLGLTDGEENDSTFPRTPHAQRAIAAELSQLIAAAPDEETYALLVPDQRAVHEAKQHGFPAANISVWDATSVEGLEEAGRVIREVADFYMDSRAHGVKGFSARNAGVRGGLFQMRDFSAAEVQMTLPQVTPGSYHFIDVTQADRDPGSDGCAIEPFYERKTGKPYPKGQCYYQFTKAEKVQGYKKVVIEVGGVLYSGSLDQTRGFLGLPDGLEVRVRPDQRAGAEIFFQSTSHNRKLMPGTRLLVFR